MKEEYTPRRLTLVAVLLLSGALLALFARLGPTSLNVDSVYQRF